MTARPGTHAHREDASSGRSGALPGGAEEGYGEDDFVVNDEAGMEEDYTAAADDDDD